MSFQFHPCWGMGQDQAHQSWMVRKMTRFCGCPAKNDPDSDLLVNITLFYMVNSYTHPVDWKLCFFSRFSPILVGIHWNFHILSQDDHILLGPFYGQLLFSWVNFYQASTADGSQLPLWCSESGESSPGPTTDLFNGKPWSFSGNTAFLFPFQMGTCAVFYIALLVINIGDCRDCLWEMVM